MQYKYTLKPHLNRVAVAHLLGLWPFLELRSPLAECFRELCHPCYLGGSTTPSAGILGENSLSLVLGESFTVELPTPCINGSCAIVLFRKRNRP